MLFLASLTTCFALVSCGQQAGPEDVISAYVDATHYQRWDEAYGYISSADKAAKSLAQYRLEAGEANELAAAIAGQTTMRILSTEITDDTATCTVEVTMPDFSGAVTELMQAAFR